MDYSNLFVVLMGVGTVFIGLICLIVLVWLMGRICRAAEKDSPVAAPPLAQSVAPANGGEIVAAIAAAIAEELGTDINAIRITSIKRV
ncbi:MAG: OadG family protein [Oscillospiraceae bacterium]|nr:OadG family protein [Oscillospiraceae bacterium]